MAQAADVRASWNISLPEGEFLVEFEHGTTSGRRLLRINGKVRTLTTLKKKTTRIDFNFFLMIEI